VDLDQISSGQVTSMALVAPLPLVAPVPWVASRLVGARDAWGARGAGQMLLPRALRDDLTTPIATPFRL
jgi:hypothetical protein